jgi:hypothetical protein
MQVNCSKCSMPIALSDIITSHNGHLSHVDCKRLRVLRLEERTLISLYCSEHVVARCRACDVDYRYAELAADLWGGSRTNMCPRCRQDLTEAVRAHVFRCVMLPVEIKNKIQVLSAAAQSLVKESRQLRDRSGVLIGQAKAASFEGRRAFREAMLRKSAS